MSSSPKQILRVLMRGAPFQPATNIWRAVELDAVLRHGLPGDRGLDLGCGDGKLTQIITAQRDPTARAIEWIGVDLDPAETAQAERTGLYRTVHTGSATAIPEADGSFDFVFSNSVLEHIGPIDAVLAEAARLLRPGGRFICTVPGPDFHACLGGALLGRTDRPAYERDIDERCAHLRYWDTETWRNHLQAQGMSLTHASSYLSQRQVRRWERVSAATGGLAYRLVGRRARPIDIQRRLRLRSSSSGLSGRIGASLSSLLTTGCPLTSDDPGPRYGCLLVEAVKVPPAT